MRNIDISQFPVYGSLAEDDYVVISLLGGSSGRVAVGVLGASFSAGAVPSIKDGVWWIGTVDTGVKAEGKTPELRRGEWGVEYRYTGEGDAAWKLLVPFEDIKLQYEDLTKEQQDEIRLKYSDLTKEQIAELQKPATDMIAVLEKTNEDVLSAEIKREGAEQLRVESEESRTQSEKDREEGFVSLRNESESASRYASEQGEYAKLQGDYAKKQAEVFEAMSPDILLGTVTLNPADILGE